MATPLTHPRPRCLLTGADGNLGQAIQRTGAFDLTCATRANWARIRRDGQADYDLVIHAAGALQLRPGDQPTAFIDSNVRALAELLEWVGPLCKPRVFFVSSCAVYGDSISTPESSPTCPVSPNGIAKLLSEKLLQAYCDEHGMDFVSFRVFNIFGGNDRFSVLHHLRQAALAGRAFVLNNQGRAHRDFVHVDDVARVMTQLASIDQLPRYLNLGTGVTTRIADVVNAFMQHMPALKIEHRECPEAEYSRANTSLLQQYTSHRFQSVLDHIPAIAAGTQRAALTAGSA
jgi:nucleoside-diphosphate-sugar epimerase